MYTNYSENDKAAKMAVGPCIQAPTTTGPDVTKRKKRKKKEWPGGELISKKKRKFKICWLEFIGYSIFTIGTRKLEMTFISCMEQACESAPPIAVEISYFNLEYCYFKK